MDQSPESMIIQAERAAAYARRVRRLHARKTRPGSQQRETDIKLALDELAKAMAPIRRRLGQLPHERGALNVEGMRDASKLLQIERRKLWKMRRKRKRRINVI